MPVTSKMYGNAALKMVNKELDWDSDTVKVALLTSSYTPDQDAHVYYSDCEPSANETSGTGYSTGGAELSGLTASYTAATNVVKLDASDVSWETASFTARTAVLYSEKTSNDTSPLWGYFLFSADETASSGTFAISWNADGIFTLTVD
jgi:hypothetical protein